jgi:hypothetical protein
LYFHGPTCVIFTGSRRDNVEFPAASEIHCQVSECVCVCESP